MSEPTRRPTSQKRAEKIEFPRFKLAESLSKFILLESEKLGFEPSRPQKTAECILKLSDFYHQNPGRPTPWDQKWAVLAYLTYFFPLGVLRSKAVVEEGRRHGFFSGIKNFFELGSGPGTLSHLLSPMIAEGYCVETSHEAIQLHRGLEKFLNEAPPADLSSKMGSRRDFDLGVFSYVLNETGFDIINSFKFQSLLIIEPSTQALARGLMDVRKRLLEKGFYLVAPCTHQGACPLLEKSGKDWCHHRISVEMPGWFIEIEKFLPMKNETVTFSYLLASRNEPIRNETEVRVIGDVLVEKGKTRQAVCFDGERRFLSWLHKEHDPSKTGLTRGGTFYLSQIDASIVSNEVRVAKPKS